MPSLRDLLMGNLTQKMSEGGQAYSEQEDRKLKQLLAEQEAQKPKGLSEYQQFLMGQRQLEQSNRRKQGLEKRVSQEGLVGSAEEMTQLEQQIPGLLGKEPVEFKSTGGLKSWVPRPLTGVAETIGLLPKGASKESQALERASMSERHQQFGATLTGGEKTSWDQATGQIRSGDPAAIQAGFRTMANIAAQKGTNLRAIYGDVAPEFEAEGGRIGDEQIKALLQGSAPKAPTSARQTRIQELKAKLGK